MPDRNPLTVGGVIRSVFPDGTFLPGEDIDNNGEFIDSEERWKTPPVLPYDLFAVCGYLIHISGLMGFFEPDPKCDPVFEPGQLLRVSISLEDSKACKDAGVQWLNSIEVTPIPTVSGLWEDLIASWQMPVRAATYQSYHMKEGQRAKCPAWWIAVFKLLIIADEACDEVGHVYYDASSKNMPLVRKFAMTRFNDARSSEVPLENEPSMRRSGQHVTTYAASADPGVVCVQPKARVTKVGCSLRNLSRNLALTGPVGGVRCGWQQLAGKPKAEEDEGLDVLLIPMPFELAARNFCSTGHEGRNKTASGTYPGWGNFEIEQEWLKSEKAVIELVVSLIKEAQKDVETVNAVVFPELSLTYEIFQKLRTEILNAEPNIEFIIAGSSSNCSGEQCNCVLTGIWEDALSGGGENSPESATVSRLTSQKKHHRWRLERNQLSDYGLSARLHPGKDWWEQHQISQRELNFFQFRKSSVFASLICEDLARNDPVHEVVRSVAPNILFALLMDGPQIPQRWPARYASTLADDPGTSVLSFTSYGLIKRVNDNSKYSTSHSVGLWKDETGHQVEIKLAPGAKGVLMSLVAETVTDVTIDGRASNNAVSWRFISQKPLFVDKIDG